MAFNGRFLLNLAYLATRKGGDMKEFLQLTGKSEEELNEESCVVDDNTYNGVLELAVKNSNDAYFGLHAGENLNLAAAGLIVQLSQSSETVKQALELCCQFANLGCSVLPLGLEEKENNYTVTFTPDEMWRSKSDIAFKQTTDGVLAFTIKEFNTLTRMKHNPIAVHLAWDRPIDISEYERVFGCPVLFNQEEIAILIRKEHVEEKVITANYHLLNILVAHATEKINSLNNDQGFVYLVKTSMINLVKPEFPTIEQVAAHLNISARTLQRRLADENTTYKKLVDELRKEFALSYMKRKDLNISNIAYLLNYGDASAFNRAFKRWTGMSPRNFRANMD